MSQNETNEVRYIVAKETRDQETGGQTSTTLYLVAINYDPYSKYSGADRVSMFSEDPEEAFGFTSIAAAEMAAVTVGGKVETLMSLSDSYDPFANDKN